MAGAEPVRVKSPAGYFDAVPLEDQISGNEEQQLNELSKTLQGTQLQERRMSQFAFEPVSLPASRVRLSLSFLYCLNPEKLKKRRLSNWLNATLMGTFYPQWQNTYSFPHQSVLAWVSLPQVAWGGSHTTR